MGARVGEVLRLGDLATPAPGGEIVPARKAEAARAVERVRGERAKENAMGLRDADQGTGSRRERSKGDDFFAIFMAP